MDTKWKEFSHSLLTKIIVFMIVLFCFSNALTVFLTMVEVYNADFELAFEDSYYQSREYIAKTNNILSDLLLLKRYQSEEHILSGATVTKDEIKAKEDRLYRDFEYSRRYNHNLTDEENYEVFKEIYAEEISQIKDTIIQDDLENYNKVLQRINGYPGLVYYVRAGEQEFTNSSNNLQEDIQDFPAYLILAGQEQKMFPEEIKKSPYYHRLNNNIDQIKSQDAFYLAFAENHINKEISEWQEKKDLVLGNVYKLVGFLAVFLVAFIYLLIIIGRKPGEDKVHLNFVDKIYTDINIGMCFSLITLWFVIIVGIGFHSEVYQIIFPATFIIGALGLILVLSLVKHLKNRTFIKHSLTYSIFFKIFKFVKDVYNSGSTGVKVVLLAVGYPLLVVATFFMFPITLGVGAWLALRKVKEFNVIKEGVERIKEGDVHHKIDIPGDGELAKLASDINGIADGLNKAVANELKSERLKTELITNVSHDIRTPLTSIITYVDLLKQEEDQEKIREYLEIIDQKAQRLKTLTDDLFEASKASSGNIPVNFEKIDIISLITQGLGELNDKIQEAKLDFRINAPEEKVYVYADGKLLWRVIENLLANVFKYALMGSRVYIDIEVFETFIRLTIKNISAYELNISPDYLMERFTRGDEARTSQGSGLGLSIAKSLVELQKGSFKIEIDGDLFKAIVSIPKYKDK